MDGVGSDHSNNNEQKEKRKVVVFDLDDTLLPEWRYVASGATFIADKLFEISDKSSNYKELCISLELLKKEIIRNVLVGENHFEPVERWLSEHSDCCTISIKQIIDEYRSHTPDIHLSADRSKALDEFKRRNITMCMITDGRSITQRNKFDALQLEKYIDKENLYISEEQGFDKTAPASWKRIMRKYGECQYYYVGDNIEKDFLMPNSLGWLTIRLATQPYHIHRNQAIHSLTAQHYPAIEISGFRELKNTIIGMW